MKKLITIILVMLTAALLQACNNASKTNTGTNNDSVNIIDTTAKLTIVVDKDDAQFAIQAANSGLAEVESGKLAIAKGADKRIKNFGAMMVKDHSKASNKLMALAKAKKITLTDTVGGNDRKSIDELSKKTGKAFDTAYISYAITAHKNAVALFDDASKHRFDPDIRRFAGKTLPILKRHLEAIEIIRASIK